jgi:transposase
MPAGQTGPAAVERPGGSAHTDSSPGYRPMLAWFRSHGELLRVSVEQSGSFAAGLTRHLALAGIPVLEVTGPAAPRQGQGDTLDAIAATKAALSASAFR